MRDIIDPANDPASALLAMAESMGPRGLSGMIEDQEKRGQQAVVNSPVLPIDLTPTDRSEWEALGFVFLGSDPREPLFQTVRVPDGWTRKANPDHDMYSYIADDLGRPRVSVFYKAAFYDRKAHARILTVGEYVTDSVLDGKEVIMDDTWATRDVVATFADAAAREHWMEEKRPEFAKLADRLRDGEPK